MSAPLDLVGIGLGPFNLGLAALCDPVADLDAVFLDAAPDFCWHGGMMLPRATLQVPFLADLVTMADPTSPYSFLAHLKAVDRLYPFYVREDFHPLRSEYDAYCRWVAGQLGTLRWGRRVVRVEHDGECYRVHADTGESWRTRRVVVGVGTSPHLPAPLRGLADLDGSGTGVVHTADYLLRKADLQATGDVTVVGSGQSAAEVFHDLLLERARHGHGLTWITRAPRHFAMDDTRLTLEMTSPDYTAYFQALPAHQRDRLLAGQSALYKGISADLIAAIHDELYAQRVDGLADPTILTGTEVVGAADQGGRIALDLRHVEQGTAGRLHTDAVVAGTGYAPTVPDFLEPVADRLRTDEQGRLLASERYAVDHAGGEVFVQNAEEHTHGFVAPDLGMGAFRNGVIVNAIAGREVYAVEKSVTVQEFGIPDRMRVSS